MFSIGLQRRCGGRREFPGAHGVDGNRHLARERVEDRPRLGNEVRFDERLADLAMRREDERVRDAAADDQRVDFGGERFQHRELRRDLRSRDDGDERPRRVGERLAERVELRRHQRARAGDRRVPRDAVRGRLGAVRGSERVVDVDVAERGHPPRKRLVVLLFTGVEPAVLEQHDAAGSERVVPLAAVDPVADQRNRQREQRRQPLCDRRQRVCRVPLAFGGAAEMRGHHDGSTPRDAVADARQRRADARVVGDRAVIVLRHVEVGADEHALAVHVDIAEAQERHRDQIS